MLFLGVVSAVLAVVCIVTLAIVLVTGKAVSGDFTIKSGNRVAQGTNAAFLIVGALAFLFYSRVVWPDPASASQAQKNPITAPAPTTAQPATIPTTTPPSKALPNHTYPGQELNLEDRPRFDHNVVRIQETLQRLGYDVRDADGHFGPETEKAVREFQHQHGLTPNGRVGYQTWEALVSPQASQR